MEHSASLEGTADCHVGVIHPAKRKGGASRGSGGALLVMTVGESFVGRAISHGQHRYRKSFVMANWNNLDGAEG